MAAMTRVLLAVAGDDLIRGAVRVAAGLALAVLLAIAFAVAAMISLFYAIAGGPAVTEPVAVTAALTRSAEQPLPPGAAGAAVVEVARAYLGMPYVWGGASPTTSFDCSGLTQWSFRQVGVKLPRTAHQQYVATGRVGTDDLRPGDLVFFAQTYPDPREWVTHVGLYVGDGLMINAPTEGKTISVQPVFAGFWGAHYAGAGRPRG